MEEFKNLKRVAMSELRKLNAQYANKEEFSESDAKKYDCMMHGLKCQLTVEAMLEAKEGGEEEEWVQEQGNSGRRGRASNGRFVSREGGGGGGSGTAQQSFAEGFSQGYSEAMNQYSEAMSNGGNSGHYQMMPYPQRRW